MPEVYDETLFENEIPTSPVEFFTTPSRACINYKRTRPNEIYMSIGRFYTNPFERCQCFQEKDLRDFAAKLIELADALDEDVY